MTRSYGYGCCLVTAAHNIPVAATFTPAKKVDQETGMRVTSDALAVKKPIWMLGDAEFDMLDWHDRLLEQGSCRLSRTTNATDPPDIEYRVEDTIAVTEERLEEAYRKRSRIETAIGVCKDLGLGPVGSRGRVRVESHVFLALCLRLAVALTNHERDNDIASPTITL
ncbi:transposase [Halococcus sediminicola]|uniref:transposase n=1 Tax=Halococcus sediminicola TaxID=1264579 RepID=UPI0009ACD650|nr:transposase [Halococcus sediminicola]